VKYLLMSAREETGDRARLVSPVVTSLPDAREGRP